MISKRAGRLFGAGVVVGGLALALIPGSGAADSNTFVCNISPSSNAGLGGTYENVVVPPNGFCLLDGATVRHDVTAEQNSSLAVANTSIGHDLIGDRPSVIATGEFAGPPGPVSVGHDLSISGSDGSNQVAFDICDTRVQHDLAISGTSTFDEIDIGDIGPESFCEAAASAPDTVGHDAQLTNNQPGRLDVGNNQIGNDLQVAGNQATGADGAGASIDVSDNQVGHDAACSDNNPPPSKDGPEDGPNSAGHRNSCG